MSTRATYRIKEISHLGSYSQYFYIHYDGYPAGAASYFNEFTKNLDSLIKDGRYRPGKAISAFGMLSFSEFTECHEGHSDTEYRYDICFNQGKEEWFIRGYKHAYVLNGQDTWTKFFDGDIKEFIFKYIREEEII